MNRRTFFAALAGVLASPFIPLPKPECFFCHGTENIVWHPGYNPGCGYHRCEKPCWNDKFFSGSEPGVVLIGESQVRTRTIPVAVAVRIFLFAKTPAFEHVSNDLAVLIFFRSLSELTRREIEH